MIITVLTEETEFPHDIDILDCTDESAYAHVKNIYLSSEQSEGQNFPPLASIDIHRLQLLEVFDKELFPRYVPLSMSVGIAVCQSPLDVQEAFWNVLEEKISSYLKSFRIGNKDTLRQNLVLVISKRVMSHSNDITDEIFPYIRYDPERKQTVIGFTSMYGNCGPQDGPDLVYMP